MELFLNLCWLALLLPAYLLWQQKTSSARSGRTSFAFLCTLGCVLVLLFPVISASDDLHAMRPEMEESERAFRHASHRGCNLHQLSHSLQPSVLSSAAPAFSFQRVGTVFSPAPLALTTLPPSAPSSRGPPAALPTSL